MNKDVAIVEVRAAVGGNEAKIWAQDLLRMYLRFAEKQGWQVRLLGKGVLSIKGSDAYEKLKNESGVHRVQRIPVTEKYGRIHTSTATVAVLPEIPEKEIKINPQDLEWQFFRASTQGGQNVQKVSSAVRLIHKPTRISVTCEQERTQEQNRQIATQLLRAKLWEREETKRQSTIKEQRSAIGRGMRAEKIRTYNFPQNRVTDHRLNKKFYNLETILDGNLEAIINKFTE
ncbi:MAG TPA: peptide chain release factor-like protein [Nevskiaceae bacterium]|nr:peptide chain release factor-like protein [Nevskiaceae bacterium]